MSKEISKLWFGFAAGVATQCDFRWEFIPDGIIPVEKDG